MSGTIKNYSPVRVEDLQMAPRQDKKHYADTGYISPNQAGAMLGVTGEAIKQWIYTRKLPAVKLANGYWKISVEEFKRFVKESTNLGPPIILVVGLTKTSVETMVNAITAASGKALVAHNQLDAALKCKERGPLACVMELGPTANVRKQLSCLQSNTSKRMPVLVVSARLLTETQLEDALKCRVAGCISLNDTAALKQEIGRLLTEEPAILIFASQTCARAAERPFRNARFRGCTCDHIHRSTSFRRRAERLREKTVDRATNRS